MTPGYYFQVLGALLLIGGILYVLYFLSLSYKKKIFSGELKLKDRLSLDKGVSVVVVEYKQSNYFFSVSEKSIQLIKEFSL